MDFKSLLDKAKAALGQKPELIDKVGDAVDSKTGKKYESQVDKAQDAAKKWSGTGDKPEAQGQPDTQGQPEA